MIAHISLLMHALIGERSGSLPPYPNDLSLVLPIPGRIVNFLVDSSNFPSTGSHPRPD
jgi:hypothetical protein